MGVTPLAESAEDFDQGLVDNLGWTMRRKRIVVAKKTNRRTKSCNMAGFENNLFRWFAGVADANKT
jgi:hypothetical protein